MLSLLRCEAKPWVRLCVIEQASSVKAFGGAHSISGPRKTLVIPQNLSSISFHVAFFLVLVYPYIKITQPSRRKW